MILDMIRTHFNLKGMLYNRRRPPLTEINKFRITETIRGVIQWLLADIPALGLLYAPTYRTEPKKKFDVDLVHQLLKEFMDKHCSEFSYNEKECQSACKRISYYIRREVKQLSFDRYRFICQVRIIEKQNQGVETQVGFLWDENFDGFASYIVDTYSFIAQAVVYGVYKD